MFLIAGLGNPGIQYARTFHNCGFDAADIVAEKLGADFSKKTCRALVAEAGAGSEKILVAKPQTYMNLSGESIAELVGYYKIPLANIVVMYDDYDLPIGSLRVRERGTAGTHNGMRNVVERLGSTEFARIRIGIKPENTLIPIMDYVLSGRGREVNKTLAPVFENAADAAVMLAKGKTVAEVTAYLAKRS